MLDLNCIFCKIANGNLPARIVARSNKAIAFLDAFPLSAGHTLIIPSSHYSKIQDIDMESLFAVFDLLQKVSSVVEKAVQVNASTIAVHNGREAGQEVPHVHIHIIPRHIGDGARPVHSMFKNVPQLNSEEMDLILEKMKRILLA